MARKVDAQIEQYILNGKSGKLGGLYTVKHTDTSAELWYQGTCIFRKEGDVITLDNGGYLTPTTKGKMNAALMGVLPISYQVYQRKGTWLLSNPKGDDYIWTTDKMLI